MHALIINPDLDSRIRLKQALNFVPEFKIVKMVSTLTEALQRLRAGESFGSVFVSTLFGHEVAREFIGQSKESAGGKESAYILTLSGGAKSVEVAADLSHGADGFLVEPFSVDALQKIYRLAVRVKKKYVLARQKESLRLLMQEAADGIDHHAFTLSRFPDAASPRSLETIRQSLEHIAQAADDVYIEVLEEVFEAITRPRKPSYKGASNRLRKKYGFNEPMKMPTVLLRVLREG